MSAALKRLLLPLLLLVALALLARWPGTPGLLGRLAEVGPGALAWAALGLLGSHGSRALRLHAEWAPRRAVPRVECLRVALLHSAAVNLMPLRSGELGFPWLLWRRWQVPLAESATSLLWMRLQDAVVVAWLGALTAAAVLSGHGSSMRVGAGLLAVGATGLLLWLLQVARASARSPLALPRPGSRLAVWLTLARGALARATPATWAWCVANWLLKVGTLGALLAALLQAPLLSGWCAALAGEGAASLPIQAPAGFGTYEAAAAMGARAAGSTDFEAALAAALLVHVFTITISLGGALWASLGGPPSPRRSASAAGASP